MSELKLLDLPAEYRRPLNGMCRITKKNEDYFVAWHDKKVLMLSFNEEIRTCDTLTVKNPVRYVFQNQTSIMCLDECGTIYTLDSIKNEDDVDIFDSSIEEDEFNGSLLGENFIPCINVKNIVSIDSMHCGFIILLKYDFGKLFIELYESITDCSEVKKTSVEICPINEMIVSQCTLKICKAESMSSNFRQQFVRTLSGENAEIVFIGLPTGCVYHVVVSSGACVFLSDPVLMYSCPYPVFKIVSLQEMHEKLFSKILIVLVYGVVVVVSVDIISGSLNFKVSNLPSYPQVIMETQNSLIFGDGIDIWYCTLNNNSSSIESKALNVKGVCSIVQYSVDDIAVATVHNTFYTFSLKCPSTLQDIKALPASHISVNEITESLCKELNQIEMYKREISCEENLISAIGIFSRHVLYEKFFSSDLSVQNLSCMSIEDYLFQHSHSYDFGDIIRGKTLFSHVFLINVVVENKSEIEFSPKAWLINTSVTTGGVTTQKCEKLLRSFSSGSSFSSSICVCIEQPFLGVSVSVSLVRQLPGQNACSAGLPWLIIPIAVRNLDITYFFKRSFVDMKSTDDKLIIKNIAHLAQKRNPKLNKLSICEKAKVFESCSSELYFAQHSNVNKIWSSIQKCSCDVIGRETDNGNSNAIGDKICVSAGNAKVEVILNYQSILISSPNPMLLCAVKNIILSKWIFHFDSVQSILLQSNIVSRILVFKEKLQIEKMTHSRSEFVTFKNAWRHFTSEHLCI